MLANFFKQSANWRNWAHGLGAALITGIADAGYQYFSHNSVDWKQCLGTGLLLAFAYLKASPLPPLDDEK